MEWVRLQLGPRDERNAARTAAWIYLVAAVVVMLSNLLVPMSNGTAARANLMLVPLLVFGGLLAWPGFAYKGALLLATPLIGAFFVVLLDLETRDASAGAQVAFCLPVLFASSQLRFLGAGVALAGCIAGDALVVLRLRPTAGGIIDVVDLAMVLVLMTGLLVQAGQRQDRLVAMLERQASYDPLTGLVTRRVLDDAVRRALSAPAVHAGTALILVDVDHFKSINDGYGHPVGDDALVHIAKVLGRQSRPDTVISRLGGDELAVLLLGCPESVARRRAGEFLRTLRANPLPLAGGGELRISISLGVAHAPSGQSDLRQLYAAADASLYQAKQAGRGRVGTAAEAHPRFEAPAAGSERVVDGLFEVHDVPNGVLKGDVGLPGDDRIDHR